MPGDEGIRAAGSSEKAPVGGLDTSSANHSPLAVFLMTEIRKGQKSFYKPYFDTLPRLVDGLPTEFGLAELELLKGSPIVSDILRKVELMKEDFDFLQANISELASFTFSDFKYCRGLVSSRVFGLDLAGGRTGGMVPFAGKF